MSSGAAGRGGSSVTVVLASGSSGRLAVLRAAGVDPIVLVSGVDEDSVRTRHADDPPADVVAALATAKADAVATAYGTDRALADAVVIAADSMLLLDGQLQGKPHTPDVARARWAAQAGRCATLLTGHAVLRVRDAAVVARSSATAATEVRIGTPTDRELDAYLASGEPLGVAGALTIDRLGGWFVEGIDGDPSNVIGLSLPLTRRLLAEIDVCVTDLWTAPRPDADRDRPIRDHHGRSAVNGRT